MTIRKIKTKSGYKIKYPNGATAYFYPNGTGKRKTKNSAYTGPVKYFHNLQGPTKDTQSILKTLYKSGLNARQTKSAYNLWFRKKIDNKYIKRIFKKFKKLKQKHHFSKQIQNNKQYTMYISDLKKLNRITRNNYLINALIQRADTINNLKIFKNFLSNKGQKLLDSFQADVKSDFSEGS